MISDGKNNNNDRSQEPQQNEGGNGECSWFNKSYLITDLLSAIERIEEGTTFRELYDCENKSLLQWSKDRGCLFTEDRIKELLSSIKSLAGGQEHIVFTAGDLAVKITIPPSFGAAGGLIDYLRNLHLSNELFKDDFRIIGICNYFELSEDQKGTAIIISQPFIDGEKATEEEIYDFMNSVDFLPYRENSFINQERNILICDARPDNVIKHDNGNLFPIDVHIRLLD